MEEKRIKSNSGIRQTWVYAISIWSIKGSQDCHPFDHNIPERKHRRLFNLVKFLWLKKAKNIQVLTEPGFLHVPYNYQEYKKTTNKLKILNFQVGIRWSDFVNCETDILTEVKIAKRIKPAINRMDGPKRRISKGEV